MTLMDRAQNILRFRRIDMHGTKTGPNAEFRRIDMHGTKTGPNADPDYWKYHPGYPGAGTKSKAFQEWFGDSQVVDEFGNPLVVYHSTNYPVSDFKAGSHFGTSISTMRLAGVANTESTRCTSRSRTRWKCLIWSMCR
jgi:hypothetical protein